MAMDILADVLNYKNVCIGLGVVGCLGVSYILARSTYENWKNRRKGPENADVVLEKKYPK
jgi:hypothetical protein